MRSFRKIKLQIPHKNSKRDTTLRFRRQRHNRLSRNRKWKNIRLWNTHNPKIIRHSQLFFFACILAPTRELCLQINQHLEILGLGIGLKTCVLVGGLDLTSQAISLSKKPHIVIGTPGRVADHLANTKGFNLKHLKFLCFDEADRLLDLDFERQINQILEVIPKERTTC